jgi:hypothetical protein
MYRIVEEDLPKPQWENTMGIHHYIKPEPFPLVETFGRRSQKKLEKGKKVSKNSGSPNRAAG